MKVKSIHLAILVLMITMVSCLKDQPYLDVTNTTPIIEFGQSPAQGLTGPFVYSGDSSTLVDTAIALVLASPQVEPDTLQSMVSLDPSQVIAYDSANQTNFTVLPDSLFTISDTVNIMPGYRVGVIKVTLKFPGIHNYALPLKISASHFLHSNQPVIVSGNSGTFMWLFP
jgi:hypothetical protein